MECISVQKNRGQLVLNTPNRNEILKDGPPQNSQVNVLGRGSYGVVLKAVFGGRQVAVKIIKNTGGKENAIHNEANILGWAHPNVVRLLKIESTSNYGIIIMERFPGQCLQLILDSIELPLEHRIHIALDVTNALIYCHSQQVLHLDVKPQNVLIAFMRWGKKKRQTHGARNYICKLCDFGSSRKFQENSCNRVHGTVRYMSPEALKGDVLSPAADVYSLGVTMWQLKARQLPYAWIECNQIVAYQVGKNHLRPNRIPYGFSSRGSQATASRHENCLCEHFSSEFSFRSLDQIRSILQKTKTLSPIQPKVPVTHRRPEKLRKQISKNLIETFVSLKQNLLVNEISCDIVNDEGEEEFSLKNVFEEMHRVGLPNAERVFETLFISCWQSDAEARPVLLDVRETLLSCFSNQESSKAV